MIHAIYYKDNSNVSFVKTGDVICCWESIEAAKRDMEYWVPYQHKKILLIDIKKSIANTGSLFLSRDNDALKISMDENSNTSSLKFDNIKTITLALKSCSETFEV